MAKNIFNSIQLKKPKKNFFDLTHDVKLSAAMGQLTPILTLEVVPGDSIELGCESIVRFAPMVAPVMHRMDVSMHYFFVPNRILWDNWEKFITNNGPNGTGPDLVAPYIELADSPFFTPERKAFLDYMGLPPVPAGTVGSTNISALPFAAYQAVYNEYYRDQNLIAPVDYKLVDGFQTAVKGSAFTAGLITLRNRAWEHDYFTSSLPFAQKGAAVDIPLGTINANAEIYYDASYANIMSGSPDNVYLPGIPSSTTSSPMYAKTDELNVEPTTINDLRRAFRLQEWLEKKCKRRYTIH